MPKMNWECPGYAVNDSPDFVVYGIAQPKGSKTRLKTGALIDIRGSRHKDKAVRAERNRTRLAWPETVRAAAGPHALAVPFPGPIALCARFFLPHPATGRQRTFHVGKPDLDKLLRGVCDPLTLAGVWRNDSQVVSFNGSEKRYAAKGALVGHPDGPRVEITIRAVVE